MGPDTALYLLDCYKKEFEAKVRSIKDGKFVVLDKTVFYPTGGGQPNDTGILIRKSDNKEFPVVFVGKFDDLISHEVQNAQDLKEGDEVIGKIDWDRRYKHMRFHTAMHLVAVLFNKETGAVTTGNQIALDKSRVDIKLENFDREKIQALIPKINALIAEGHPVKLSYVPREEAEKRLKSFNFMEIGFDPNIKDIRIVDVEGFNAQACGGTHIANTKEIGSIQIVKMENKGKDNRRIYFELVS
ncbi:MAG TPA: alanyl-tRNA editing protein AlaXM [Candidatus Nanoarchaeia archaeon]|nr:alanyl-tRNA editing protein AlaXM [Candidatus Nanoarchaeia archaeon]